MTDDGTDLNRRDFIRKAAMTTAAAAWAAPVIQTIAATPAFAQSQGTPPTEDSCGHSTGINGGCMGACGSVCGGDQCGGFANPSGTQVEGPCTTYCAPGQGNDNPCVNIGLCNPANFVCSGERHGAATYIGPL
jgi:hypothetical protein